MGRILIKLGENVGTLIRLIVLKFIKIGLVFDVNIDIDIDIDIDRFINSQYT